MATQDSDLCINELQKSQVIGLSFIALSGFISSLSVVFVLLLVLRNYIRNIRDPPAGGEWKLIRTHVDAYLLSLLASDFLQGLGAILNIKWASEKRVYCSATCTAQGMVQQIGETGVAMAVFAIALHTFLVIFFRWCPGPRAVWIWRIVIALIWLFVLLFAVIAYTEHNYVSSNPAEHDIFFTPTPFWCWITVHFGTERIVGEYFWLWFAAIGSIVFYLLLFFRVRGNITVDPHDWKEIRFKWRRWTEGADDDAYYSSNGKNARGGQAGKDAAREALAMIWYPITYTILVLPLSIVRWSDFQSPDSEPPAVTFIVVFIFGLSGIVNATLMLVTRKNLLLFGQRGVVDAVLKSQVVTGRSHKHDDIHHHCGNSRAGGDISLVAEQFRSREFQRERDFDASTAIEEGMSRYLGTTDEYGNIENRLCRSDGDHLNSEQDGSGSHGLRSNFLDINDSESGLNSSQGYVPSSFFIPPSQSMRLPLERLSNPHSGICQRGDAVFQAASSSRRPGMPGMDYSSPMVFNPTLAPTQGSLSPLDIPRGRPRNESKMLPSKSTKPTKYNPVSLVPTLGAIASFFKSPLKTQRPGTGSFGTSILGHSSSSLPANQDEIAEIHIRPLHLSHDFSSTLRGGPSLTGSEKGATIGHLPEHENQSLPENDDPSRTRP